MGAFFKIKNMKNTEEVTFEEMKWKRLSNGVIKEPLFDYVIVDEASQALLAMFAGAKLLDKKKNTKL